MPLKLYTSATPNGWKASVALEEIAPGGYEFQAISLSKMEQKEEWFVKINPNGRIPALVDTDAGINVFETGAILIYLAEKFKRTDLLPEDPAARAKVFSWIMFQMGGQGPMQGQANHFLRYAPEKIEYGIKRYQNESRRLYEVMDATLKETGAYITGSEYTLADVALYPWAFCAPYAEVSLDGLDGVKGWMERVGAREAVKKGMDVPVPNPMLELVNDKEKMAKVKAEAAKMMVKATD